MIYELWDVDVGNCVAYEHSEVAMAKLVRTLVTHYGDAYANDLDLTIEDGADVVLGHFRGAALIRWAEEVMRRIGDPVNVSESRIGTTPQTTKRPSNRGIAAPARRDDKGRFVRGDD
jgi:hypothetical protein